MAPRSSRSAGSAAPAASIAKWVRRSARCTWPSTFPGRRQAARAQDDRRHRAGHGQGHRRSGLDERRNQGQGQGKAAHGNEQDRLSRQVARLFEAEIVRGDALGNQERVRAIRVRPRPGQDRQAGRQGRVAYVAAHRQRVLRSAAEQRELSCRLFSAAVLQRQGRRRGQLRRHGLDHRPRTDPRLRRRGPPVRQGRQPEGLVDQGRRAEVQRPRRNAWSSSTTPSKPSPAFT